MLITERINLFNLYICQIVRFHFCKLSPLIELDDRIINSWSVTLALSFSFYKFLDNLTTPLKIDEINFRSGVLFFKLRELASNDINDSSELVKDGVTWCTGIHSVHRARDSTRESSEISYRFRVNRLPQTVTSQIALTVHVVLIKYNKCETLREIPNRLSTRLVEFSHFNAYLRLVHKA